MIRGIVQSLVLALLASLTAGATASSGPQRFVDELFTDVEVTEGIVFADGVVDYRGQPWTLRLDLYEPAGDTLGERPLLVWAHGGSGIGGRRDEGNAVGWAETFARRGWVVASIDYRLYSQELPEQCSFHDFCRAVNPSVLDRINEAAEDFRAAVRYLRLHAGEHRIDPERVVGGGFSYGTVLALKANFQPEPIDVAYPNNANPGVPSAIAGAVTDSGGMHETLSIDQPAPPLGPGEPPMIGWAYRLDRDGAAALTTLPCLQTRALGNVCDLQLLDSGTELRHGVGPGLAATETAEFFCTHAIDCSTGEEPAIVKTADIRYGHAENCLGDDQELLLDLYELEGDTRPFRPVYVWAHGGFFKFGSKDGIPDQVVDYVRSGWVVLSIGYRLCSEIPTGYPGLLESDAPADDLQALLDATEDTQHDMQAAVRWVRRNAGAMRFDASRVAAGGFSAGAITALQTAFDENDPGTSGNEGYPSVVAAAVSHAGGYLHGVMGDIGPGEPPIAMLHGTHDQTVPMAAAVPACAQTVALLNVCEFTPFFGEEHRVLGADIALDFLQRHVAGVAWTPTTLTLEATRLGNRLNVQARLTAAGIGVACELLGCPDEPLAGQELHVEVAGLATTIVTGSDGTATGQLRLPPGSQASLQAGGDHAVIARYHGGPGLEPELTSSQY